MELAIANIGQYIYSIRGTQVMLDKDLAILFEMPVKRLNERVRRNAKRFSANFAFQLTKEEVELLNECAARVGGRGRYSKYLPWAFTQEGVAILSGILDSERAIEINISILTAFVELRKAPISKDIEQKVAELKDRLIHYEERQEQRFQDLLVLVNNVSSGEQVSSKRNSRSADPVSQEFQHPGLLTSPVINRILFLVSSSFGTDAVQLRKATRTKTVVLPRQVAMHLIRKFTDLTLKDVGALFGIKDHTTVLHACLKIERLVRVDTLISNALRHIEDQINQESS